MFRYAWLVLLFCTVRFFCLVFVFFFFCVFCVLVLILYVHVGAFCLPTSRLRLFSLEPNGTGRNRTVPHRIMFPGHPVHRGGAVHGRRSTGPPARRPRGRARDGEGSPSHTVENASAVSLIWDKVLNEELLQVGDDEVSYTFFLRANARASNLHGTKIQVPLYDFGVVYVRTCF